MGIRLLEETRRGPAHGPRRLQIDPLEERRLLSVSLTGLPHQIIDNQDAAYSETGGNWESWNASDLYGGACRYHAAGDGAATAQWTFGSLDPTQSYQIYAAWNGSSNHGSNVPYTVYDGTTALATVQLNQQFAPDQATLGGQGFESLGAYRTDGSLSVQMSDAANGDVVANAIVLVEVPAVTATPSVVDNADAAYTETGGGWLGWSSSDSYHGDCRYAPAGNGSNTATWTFQDVDPTQQYQVYATWNAAGNHASNAPYTVYDDTTALATVQLNQQSAPTDATIDGWTWQSVGTYQAESGTLVVSLSDDANGYVVADAVRLVEVTPATTTPTIVDNADAAFAETGSDWLGWSSSDNYGGGCRYAPAGTGSNTASWTFSPPPVGTYQVYATWNAAGNHASNAAYTVLDGGTPLSTVYVDQQTAPDDLVADGQGWASLGVYAIHQGVLTVQISDSGANGYVAADAVRIEKVTCRWRSTTPTLPARTRRGRWDPTRACWPTTTGACR